MTFDHVAEEYEAGRPDYPGSLFDALEPLAGLRVLEGGAGTGIATRSLLARGAEVVAFDVSAAMLTRAVRRVRRPAPVIADGAAMPFRDQCADLVCFAQSWHWLAEDTRCEEVARVLRPDGRWAGWWSHPRADGEPWFEAAFDLIEATCPGVHRDQRDIDWGEDVRRSGRFTVADKVRLPWPRHVNVERWLADERSKSYIAALGSDVLSGLLAGLEQIARGRFANGEMTVPYETWLWTATRNNL